MSLLTLAWMAFIPLSLMMLASWLLQMRTRDAGTVDIAWAFGTGAVGVWFALAERGTELTRQFLAAAVAAFAKAVTFSPMIASGFATIKS